MKKFSLHLFYHSLPSPRPCASLPCHSWLEVDDSGMTNKLPFPPSSFLGFDAASNLYVCLFCCMSIDHGARLRKHSPQMPTFHTSLICCVSSDPVSMWIGARCQAIIARRAALRHVGFLWTCRRYKAMQRVECLEGDT